MRKAIGLLALAAVSLAAQGPRARLVRDLSPGCFLVSQEGLPDPNFHDTVIWLVHYDEEGAMGLVLNRPTEIPVSELFEDMEGAEKREEPVYIGGPVARGGVLAIWKSAKEPEEAKPVAGDVYLVSTIKGMEEAVSSKATPSEFRVFAGYSGWGAGQLENELVTESWHIFEGDASIAFDQDPKTLWERMIEITQMRIAKVVR